MSQYQSPSRTGPSSSANSSSSAASPLIPASTRAQEWCATRSTRRLGAPSIDRYRAPSNGWNSVEAIPGAYPTSCRIAASCSNVESAPTVQAIRVAFRATPLTCDQRRGIEEASASSETFQAQPRSPTTRSTIPRRQAVLSASTNRASEDGPSGAQRSPPGGRADHPSSRAPDRLLDANSWAPGQVPVLGAWIWRGLMTSRLLRQ